MAKHKMHVWAWSVRVMVVLVLFGLTVGGIWPAAGQEVEPTHSAPSLIDAFKPGEILVKFKEGVSTTSAHDTLEPYEATYVRTLYGSEVELWRVPEGSELQVIQRLNAEPFVEYAEPNYRIYAFDNVPNDPSFGNQWAHTVIRSPAAWDLSTGSTNVTISIIDTGIDETHPDLAGKIVAGYDFVDNDSNPHDLNGHGTHVAGIAAAVTNNGVGVAGMDWQARIMPIRVLDEGGSGYVDAMVDGILWAYAHGAKVINLSLGSTYYSQSAQDAVNQAHAAGRLVVAAMGNSGNGTTFYPAAYNNVLAVAATNWSDYRASYSSYGNHCDVAAPGGEMTYYHDPEGIYSTMPTYSVYMTTVEGYSTQYDYVSGTSQAAPHVTGLAALLWAVKSTLTPDQVRNAITSTAVDRGTLGWDPYYGSGRIDVLAALQVYSPPAAPVLSPIRNADGDGAYEVDWNDVLNASGYTLQEDDNPSFASPTTRAVWPSSQYQVTGQQGGIWYYRVLASNGNGNGPWSSVQEVGVKPGPPALSPIVNPGSEDAYQITWSTVAGATGYTLQEDDDPSFGSPATRYMGKANQYNVTGQRTGTWTYRVLAYSTVGSSAWSGPASTTVAYGALPWPTLNPIDNADGDGEYLVDWDWTDTITPIYVLEESRNPYFGAPVETYTGPESQFLVPDQSGGAWYYRVRLLGPEGKSPWSDHQSVVVPVFAYLPLVARSDSQN